MRIQAYVNISGTETNIEKYEKQSVWRSTRSVDRKEVKDIIINQNGPMGFKQMKHEDIGVSKRLKRRSRRSVQVPQASPKGRKLNLRLSDAIEVKSRHSGAMRQKVEWKRQSGRLMHQLVGTACPSDAYIRGAAERKDRGYNVQ